MNLRLLDAAASFTLANWDRFPGGDSSDDRAADLELVFCKAASGDPTWVTSLRDDVDGVARRVGGKVASQFVDYASDYSFATSRAVALLGEPVDADLFWDVALTPVGGLSGLGAVWPGLRPLDARASVASLVLFAKRPREYPVYDHSLAVLALTRLLDEPLAGRTVAARLQAYYEGIERLGRLLGERGVLVRGKKTVLMVLRTLDLAGVIRTRRRAPDEIFARGVS